MLADKVETLQAQVEQLTLASLYAGQAEAPEPSFDNVPAAPSPGETNALQALADHLERAAQGRIVFTSNAIAQWKKADKYPTPADMRDSLIKLAKVAADIYGEQDLTVGHMDNWIRENFDLKVSLQDDNLPKQWAKFEWQGVQLDRTPHVKVNDGVPPYACGRIYFAFDSARKQLVVDHVGLHA